MGRTFSTITQKSTPIHACFWIGVPRLPPPAEAPAAPPARTDALEARDKAIANERAAIKVIRDNFTVAFLRDNRSKLPATVQLALLIQPAKRNDAQKKLAADNAANQARIAELKGIEAVLAAAQKHPEDAEVQRRACTGLAAKLGHGTRRKTPRGHVA